MTLPDDWRAVTLLGHALVHFLWQGAAVAGTVALVLGILRDSSANARYAVGCAGLLGVALCPIGTCAWLALQYRNGDAPAPGAIPFLDPTGHWAWGTPVTEGLLPWLVAAWLGGVSVLSLRLLGGWIQVQRLRRWRTRPVAAELAGRAAAIARRLGVQQAFEVLASDVAPVPMVVGWLRATVLVPAGALTGIPAQHLEAILAHELAHVRRHDYLVNALQAALETLLFYHPAVWWISRRVRSEREHCCDDLAAMAVGDPVLYARALVSMEELRAGPVALAPAANGGVLMFRIRRLIGLPAPQPDLGGGWIAVALVLGAMLLPPAIAGPQPAPADAPPVPPPPTPSVAAPAPPPAPSAPSRMRRRDRRRAVGVPQPPSPTPPALAPVPAPPSPAAEPAQAPGLPALTPAPPEPAMQRARRRNRMRRAVPPRVPMNPPAPAELPRVPGAAPPAFPQAALLAPVLPPQPRRPERMPVPAPLQALPAPAAEPLSPTVPAPTRRQGNGLRRAAPPIAEPALPAGPPMVAVPMIQPGLLPSITPYPAAAPLPEVPQPRGRRGLRREPAQNRVPRATRPARPRLERSPAVLPAPAPVPPQPSVPAAEPLVPTPEPAPSPGGKG